MNVNEQIIENARQICLAMGMIDLGDGSMKYGKSNLAILWLKNQNFYCSWSSLMPVVKKFLEMEIPNHKWSRAERFASYLYVSHFNNIEVVYDAVVKYAKWYNALMKEENKK
jgi:hypothetical protein